MKFILLSLIVFLYVTVDICAQSSVGEPRVVQYVDLNKYVGLWYEIAKIPNRFQKHCKRGTTAEYRLLENGKIEVINSCIDEAGERDETEGIARVIDKSTNAKLEVSFVSILGFNFFWGDYWIIGLDTNYEYAVIGTPTKKYGWVLSRKPKLSEEKLKEVYGILTEQGYDPPKFEFTEQ